MPLLHIATYIDLGLFTGVLFSLDLVAGLRRAERDKSWRPQFIARMKRWGVLLGLALLLGLPQVLMILPQAAYRHNPLMVQLGWMAAANGHQDSFVWFWFINTALLIPLSLLTLFSTRWGKPNLGRFTAPAWVLFAVPNVLVLQPWDWDNTKWLIWWAIFMSMLAGLAVQRIGRMGVLGALLAGMLLFVQLASGAIDLTRASRGDLLDNNFAINHILFLDNDELAVAGWAERSTPTSAVFLTAWQHNHPILTMSRRVEVMGYPGWLWSWGINYCPRMEDVVRMYQGDPGSVELMRRYGVNYVVIGPKERAAIGSAQPCAESGPQANVGFFESHFPVVYKSPKGEYEIFKVS
jgi:hypothetical protein